MKVQMMLLYASSVLGASPLHTLLHYQCVTKEVANQCEESFTLAQRGYANRGFTANFSLIDLAHKEAGISSLFAVHDTFFSNGQGLEPGWKEAWHSLAEKLNPLVHNGRVSGIFLGDELLSGHKVRLFIFFFAILHVLFASFIAPSLPYSY